MIRRFLALALILCVHHLATAQDEGPITKKARVLSKSTTLYLGLGPSFSLGTGDYSGGLNVQAGLQKRLNRIVSIGPSLSLTKFNYDNSKGNTTFVEQGGYEIKKVRMQGGNLQLMSLGLDLKFNFIPSERIKKFSFYSIARPYLLISKRSLVKADVETWYRDEITDNEGTTWYYSGTSEELNPVRWNADTEVSAGMNLGVGGEWIVSSGLSFFLQSGVGFTLPITQVNSIAFPTNLNGYNSMEYPFTKKSFSSFSISVGVAYTF